MDYIIGNEEFELSNFWKEVFSYGCFMAGSFPLFLNDLNIHKSYNKKFLPGDIDVFCYEEKNLPSVAGLLSSCLDEIHQTQFSTSFCKDGRQSLEVKLSSPADDNIRDVFLKPEDYLIVQLIKLSRTTKEDILSNFDILNCRIGFIEYEGKGRFLYPDGFYTNRDNIIVDANAIYNPYITFNRLAKYAKKGFTVSTQEHHQVLRAFERLSPEEKILMEKQNPYEFVSCLATKHGFSTIISPIGTDGLEIEI